ncbi:MAG: hypothetical protein AAGA48_06275 [Myxococcota bacterium]
MDFVIRMGFVVGVAILSVGCGGKCNADLEGFCQAELDVDTWARWRIGETTNADGKPVPRIEDESRTVADATIDDAVALLRDVPGYVTTFEVDEALIIETLAEDRWLIYEAMTNPWPVKNNDRVCELSVTVDDDVAHARFVAVDGSYPDQGVARQSDYEVTYTFTDLGAGKLEIHEQGNAIPPVKVPKWLLKSAFPDVLFDSLLRMKDLLEGR